MERKPPVMLPPQSRDPHSIRFSPVEWEALSQAARSRGLEPCVFVRQLTLRALTMLRAQAEAEASLGMLGTGR